jgi:hypothetical protein
VVVMMRSSLAQHFSQLSDFSLDLERKRIQTNSSVVNPKRFVTHHQCSDFETAKLSFAFLPD